MKVVIVHLLNRRQPIPTEEASSQLPPQPRAATEVARRETERRARKRERQGEAFMTGELTDTELSSQEYLTLYSQSVRASDKVTSLCNPGRVVH